MNLGDNSATLSLFDEDQTTIKIPLKNELPELGEKMIIGIRPEHIQSSEGKVDPGYFKERSY